MRKSRILYSQYLSIAILSVGCFSFSFGSELIPSDGDYYYSIGGGDITPLPYDSGTHIELDVGGNASLGANCGAFSPEASIVNSLNGVGHTFGALASDVKNNLTGMIVGEGGYVMAKAMPNVYKFMRDGFEMGQEGFSMDTKSCQTMLSEVDQGQNPGKDWMNMAIGQDWQYHMSVASSQAAQTGLLGSDAADITQAKAQIDKNAGKAGVQWVQGVAKNGQLFAGGEGQPIIQLTHDTVIAGYNILIGNRSYNDTTSPSVTKDNAGITSVFSSPTAAAKWAQYVIGEQTITTYSGGSKKTTPGQGLLQDIQTQTQTLKPILTKLITGETQLSLKALHELDSPKITINVGVIQAIQKITDPTLQAIWVNRVTEGIATNRVINKARLLQQLLLVGSEAPSIAANDAAQKGIQRDLKHLALFMQGIRQGPGDTQTFLANTLSALLSVVHQQEEMNASVKPTSPLGPDMEHGAISTS